MEEITEIVKHIPHEQGENHRLMMVKTAMEGKLKFKSEAGDEDKAVHTCGKRQHRSKNQRSRQCKREKEKKTGERVR